jgi:hypothetical protein
MKKFYLVLLGFTITIAVYGQEEYHHSFGKNYFSQNKLGQKERHSSKIGISTSRLNRNFLKKSFQEKQHLDSVVEYVWVDGVWLYDFKMEYDYNDEEQMNEYRGYQWNESSGEWQLYDREEYEYNEAGNIVLLTDYDMEETSQQWLAMGQREFHYDDNHLLTHYDESERDGPGEEWYFTWRTTYTYDDNNRLSSAIDYLYIIGWSPFSSSEYSYDEIGNLIRYEEYNDDDAGGWVNDFQENYYYDENNRFIEYIAYDWDETDSEWVESDRETFTYQDNNNVEVYTDYDWSEGENDWILAWKEEYEYDNTYPYDQLILPYYYHDDHPNFMNHQLTEFHNYTYENSEWVPSYMGYFFFSSDPATKVSDIDKAAVQFYPNPAGQEITFKFDSRNIVDLQIYNLAGNLIQSQQVKSNKPVNIEQLTHGIYLFRLIGERNELIYSDKILVK